MYWPPSVPGNATRKRYFPLNGRNAAYFVWLRPSSMHEGHRWGWWALGNNGFAESQIEAEEMCKRWIRDRQ